MCLGNSESFEPCPFNEKKVWPNIDFKTVHLHTIFAASGRHIRGGQAMYGFKDKAGPAK